MKIALASDLHLEFGDITLDNTQGADVLVLAGDICVATHFRQKPTYAAVAAKEYRKFFKHVCKEFEQVVYIMGNHEHYSGDIAHSYRLLKENLAFDNLHLLEKESWTYQGHTFIGGTLWTDINNSDPLSLNHIRNSMNDFREVRNSNRMIVRRVPIYERNPLWTDDGQNGGQYNRDAAGAMICIGYKDKEEPARWTPEDTVEDHKKMLDYIDHVTRDPGSYIVVGHHSPSERSVAERFKNETLMNGGFRSNLEEFVLNHPQIKLWFHGHMHNNSDYMIGDTRVVCNPRGYIGHEAIADNFKIQYINV